MKKKKIILGLLFAALIFPVNLIAGCSETTRIEEEVVPDNDVIIPDTAEENEDINVNIESDNNVPPPTVNEESNINITVPETKSDTTTPTTENEEESTTDTVTPGVAPDNVNTPQ